MRGLRLGLAILVVSRAALSAEVSEEDKQAAREEYNQGYALQESGACGEAINHYRVSYKIFRATTTALHIAQCHRALGKLEEAARVYRTIVDTPIDPSAPEAFRRAQEQAKNELEELENQQPRKFGTGIGFGGGVAAGTLRVNKTLDDTSASPEILLPTFELSWYLPGEHAINLYVPLTNNIIGCGLAKGFVWNMDVMFTFNIGTGDLRFVTGPGIGFTVLFGQLFSDGPNAAGGGLRLPGEIGLEYLWAHHTYGVKFAARPWIEVSTERVDYFLGSGANINTTGGGILGMITITRFSLKGYNP